MERVRFSPAPTGPLHLGGARTALFDVLTARRNGGSFIVRFEDTDTARVVPGAETAILDDLRWLGLDPDEAPDVGGPVGPYRQSERTGHYEDAVAGLVAVRAVYPCFCTPEELEAERERDGAAGRPPRYRGTCRAIEETEARRRIEAGEPHAWRFAVGSGEVVVPDLVHGPVRFVLADIGDFVVVRSDGSALFDLACAVDDAAMRVTTVIRGDDHLSNTPRQILLLEALRSVPPRYAHVPLVTDTSGKPLSKSHGAEPVAALREEGYLPEAVVHHLALLGWSDPRGRRLLTLPQLVEDFDVSRVSSSPAVHDPLRLRRLNGLHLRALPRGERISVVERHLGPIPEWADRKAAVSAVAEDVEVPSEASARLAAVWDRPAAGAGAGAFAPARARDAITEAIGAIRSTPGDAGALRSAIEAAHVPARVGLPAVRAALTGAPHGLLLPALLALLPPAECVARLESALDFIDTGRVARE